MNELERRPRLAWAAVAFSLVATGVGHIYCGQIAKGLLLFCAWFLVVPVFVMAAILPPSTTTLIVLIAIPALFLVVLHLLAAIDAFRVARRVGANYQLRDYNRAAIYLALILVALVYRVGLTAGVRETAFEAFYIPTRSMSPTILRGDRLLVNKTLGQQPQRGELVVFHSPNARQSIFVKRVVGLSGDRVSMADGRPLINGEPLEQVPVSSPAILQDQSDCDLFVEHAGERSYHIQMKQAAERDALPADMRQIPEFVVPSGYVFVLGDNRDNSRDSRAFGTVPIGDIVGTVQYVHFPAQSWSRFGTVR